MNTVELIPEQQRALDNSYPIRAVDPRTATAYVLVRETTHERIRTWIESESADTAALMNEVKADDDANDPYLDGYQQLERTKPSRHFPQHHCGIAAAKTE